MITTEENELFINLLKEPNGAVFYRADFHNHTPIDKNFNCNGYSLTTDDDKRKFARAYVETVIEKKIQILGVTEHNDVSYIDLINEAASEKGLVFFPGVELGAQTGKRQVHFIALFDPDTNQEKLDHFLSSLGLPPGARFHSDGNPRLCQKSSIALTEFITSPKINDLRGLPIAAHASSKNGLLNELEGEARAIAYNDKNLLAIEIPETRDKLPDGEKRIITGKANDTYGTKQVACLNHSDGRGLNNANDGRNVIGSKSTLIKLSDFSIEALRQAFIDFDSRIRLEGEYREEKYPRILGLVISNGFLSSKSIENQETPQPFKVRFNPNLNTIIGGRGTGKSALVETIRYVFDIPARTDETISQSEKIIDFTFPSGSKAALLYELPDSTQYIIRRIKGFEPEVFSFATGEKVDIKPSKLLSDETPVEVYGQKEIFEISKDVNFQLNLLDTYISESLHDFKNEENVLLQQLRVNAHNILQIEEEIIQAKQSIHDIKSLKFEISRMEQNKTVTLFEQKKLADREEVLLNQSNLAVQNLIELLNRTNNEIRLTREVLPDIISLEIENLPNLDLIKEEVTRLEKIDNTVSATINNLLLEINNIWNEGIKKRAEWHKYFIDVQDNYKQLMSELGEKDFSAERYFSLRAKLAALLGVEKEIIKRETRLVELKNERKHDLELLRDLRYKKEFSIRESKAKHLTDALSGNIKIVLIYEGNRKNYTQFISELFAGRKIQKDIFSKLSNEEGEFTTPIELANAIRFEKTNPSDDQSILNNVYGISPAYRSRLADIDESILFELETFRIPDLPEISLKVGAEFRPLNPQPGQGGLSTGQKCTAILSIILVERKSPLIIDQPEDDLDNEFIFKEIVQTLRREKERRQFIIATHNANIPVSGDAELIILLQADEQHGWIDRFGSIDDPKMREPVENILEGGKDAFLIRQKKYELME